MTDPASARVHVDALLALLNGAGLPTYDAQAPAENRPERYAVLYSDPGTPSGTLGDRHRDLLIEFVLHGVGSTREQAQHAVDLARLVLLTTVPTVAGRVVQPLWQVGAPPPIQRDDDLTPAVFFQPITFQMRSTIP